MFGPSDTRAPRLTHRAFATCLTCLVLFMTAPATVTVVSGADLTCATFANQADAQAVLDAGAGDRFGLDPDGDGIACNEASPANGETGAATPQPTATPAASFADPIAADVDAFWRRTFKRAERDYASPAIFAAVDAQTSTPCGFLDFSPAFYCELDGGIYYDLTYFAERNDDGYGHASWVLMTAHEWGHRVQDLLGELDDERDANDLTVFSMAIELQAQCAAGAYVRDALRRDVLQQIEADRADLIAHTFLSDSSHGSSSLHADSYERGRAKGFRACGFEF